ncbi:MAG: 4-hydroxybutyrate dehydrogenase [Christensenellales bacterium]
MGKPFAVSTKIYQFDSLDAFIAEFKPSAQDLVVSNRFIYDPLIAPKNLPCKFIFQEKYGAGEPSDLMVEGIMEEIGDFKPARIIGVGGGTVIDICKVLALKPFKELGEIYDDPSKIVKQIETIIIPTTCGTGSEVTNVAVFELTRKHTKMGIANENLYPNHAVLIPEMLSTLPYKFFLFSSADALIHASESYLSPNATVYSELFSVSAIQTILKGYKALLANGPEYRASLYNEFMLAGNIAGIAFGYAGTGAVHGMSYPLGGAYHVAHGESNYQLFTAIFKEYNNLQPKGKIEQFNAIVRQALDLPDNADVCAELDKLVGTLIPLKRLSEYGMKESDIQAFTDNVMEKQQRLMRNAYVPMTREVVERVYRNRF